MKAEIVKYLLDCYVKERAGEDVLDGPRVYKMQAQDLQPQSQLNQVGYGAQSFEVESQQQVNVSFTERERCRLIAKKLADIADDYEARRFPTSQDNQSASTEFPIQGLDEEEMKVLNDIKSAGSFPSVTTVAQYLTGHLTSQTFKGALFHLCAQATSYPQELSLAFELYKATLPRSRRNSITQVITDFLQDRPELDTL